MELEGLGLGKKDKDIYDRQTFKYISIYNHELYLKVLYICNISHS